jgi:biopolymer transport protein ExbD/biopolymer transport protein TolR
MNHLLDVCLAITLATSVAPSLVAQTNPDAIPTLRKGISVELPVASTAVSMADADKEDALVVSITDDGTIYVGLDPTNPTALLGELNDALSNQPRKKLYIKADARAPYAEVAEVLSVSRSAGVEALNLLTAHRGSAKSDTLMVPEGLVVLVGPRLSSSSGVITVRVSNSEEEQPMLKVNRESVPLASLQNKVAHLLQDRSDRVVQIDAHGSLPFAHVVSVIDACHSTGVKIVLATPER